MAAPEATKPMRPRLPRRPHVTAGSAAEGEWARKCIAVMTQYMAQLDAYDPNEKVSVPDLRKLAGWYKKIGHNEQERATLDTIKLRAQRRKRDE